MPAEGWPEKPLYYDISYVREINKNRPDKTGFVVQSKVKPEEISQYLAHCPICGKNVRVLSGRVDNHPKDGPLCYGSFLPLK